MKKTSRLLIFSIALILAGALLTAATIAVAGLPFADEYLPTRTRFADITNINVDLRAASVLVMPTGGDEIVVTSYEREGVQTVSVTAQNGVVSITEHPFDRDRFDIRNYISFGGQPEFDVEIAIPRKLWFVLQIQTTAGRIVCGDVSLSALDLHTTSGTVEIDDCLITHDLDIELTSGYLSLEELSVRGNIRISTTSGAASLASINCFGDMTVQGNSGSLSFADEISVLGSLSVERSSGLIEAEHLSAGKAIKLITNSGRISVDQMKTLKAAIEASSGGIEIGALDAWDQRLETTSGAISVKLSRPREKYSISAQTTSGRISLPHGINLSEQPKYSLTARTTSGNIRIAFSEDEQSE